MGVIHVDLAEMGQKNPFFISSVVVSVELDNFGRK
jgi:hypothetical protein